MRVAVVGHHEWIEAYKVERLPSPGDIVHADPSWEAPAGGAPAAAGQMLKLAGNVHLFTAFGDDELGHRAHDRLTDMGMTVHATFREEPTRRGIVHIDRSGERTITVIGDRLHPSASDDLAWDLLEGADACYFTAGDYESVRLARSSRVLVATTRVIEVLSGVQLDAVVGSASDPAEIYNDGAIEPKPHLVVLTDGDNGGTFSSAGEHVRRYRATAPPGPIIDRYGAGDSFAAGLAFGLATGTVEAAIELASECAASVITGRGPYEGQIDPR